MPSMPPFQQQRQPTSDRPPAGEAAPAIPCGGIRAISTARTVARIPMPSINPDRLLGDLYALRKIGAYKTGVHRPTLSPEDVASRQWLAERMGKAGLEPVIDGIGNVLGFSRASGRKMLAGSHIETQNHAGWLDGALGVIYALEAARAFAEDAAGADLGVDVAAFCDEEGHFGNFMGSRSFVGVLTEADIDKARDRTSGTPMREALAKAGYAGRPRLAIDPSRYAGYFEAHIEQGATLESTGLRIGVDGDRRHPAVPHQGDRRAEPCRHRVHGPPARRRAGAGAAAGGDRPALPGGRRTAQRVDHRPHHARTRRP